MNKNEQKLFNRYKEGYNILMDYWDSFQDFEKDEIDKRLEKVQL